MNSRDLKFSHNDQRQGKEGSSEFLTGAAELQCYASDSHIFLSGSDLR